MGVTSNGVKGNFFDTPQLGVRAQVQHLKTYASTDALENACIDPRFRYVTRGCAEYAEWLGQKENPDRKGWAAGAGYGGKILSILKGILGTAGGTSKPGTAFGRPGRTLPRRKGRSSRWITQRNVRTRIRGIPCLMNPGRRCTPGRRSSRIWCGLLKSCQKKEGWLDIPLIMPAG